jgi:hypothetical protein
MKFVNTSNNNSASNSTSSVIGQVVMPPVAATSGNQEYVLKEGEVILEVKLGLGKKASNAPNGIATLRGTDPVGGFYRNSKSQEVFVKVALATMLYKNGKLSIGEDGLPETGLINGVLRVNQPKQLSPLAQELAQGLATCGIVPIDPKSPQAEALCNTPERQAALQELRGGGETRKGINTRQAWEAFSMQFFGEKFVEFFTNPENAEEWAQELEELGAHEELKNHSLVIGYRLVSEGQPCWTERELSSVGKKVGNQLKDTLIEGTDQYLKKLPVNMEIAYMHLHALQNRVVDPSKSMNKDYFQSQLNAFLSMDDKSSEGIGKEVIEARQNKWASIKETLRGEAGGKKRVIARKEAIRTLAKSGTPEAIEELKATFKELEAMVAEGTSPHWKAGGISELLKEVETSLGHDLYEEASPSKVEAVEPDELGEVEEVEEEETEGVVSLNPDDLKDPKEEAATPEVAVASGSAAARLLMMRKAK